MAEEVDGGELVPVVEAAAAVELTELEEQARSFAHDSRATATWRAYESDFADFRIWCAERVSPVEPLPAAPAIVALYITALVAKSLKPSTIRRRLASISVVRQVAGFETPTADARVRAVWAGIRRRQGMAPRKMRAARTKVITAMVAPLGDSLGDVRDRTLLLFGFAGALRRSELVALDVEDVAEDDGGLRLVLHRSKTDQDAEVRPGASPTAVTRRRAQCAPGGDGSATQASTPVRRSGPLIVTATSAPSD